MGLAAVASDGSRVVGGSIGVFAGLEGTTLLAYYESARSASGWVTSSISPSSTAYPAQELLDANVDLGRSLWGVRGPSESAIDEDFAVREPSGRFVPVGPTIPPEADVGRPLAGGYLIFADKLYFTFAGASSDLTHVFFQIESGGGALWPGDTTQSGGGARSLYEYVGTDNTHPELVGVNAAGQLISNCGVALGSGSSGYNKDVYNAISADGETVFFTPLPGCGGPSVSEVYARVGRAPGKTVAVSEPSVVDCETCQTTAPESAEFQGASSDGARVFFLTSQELVKGASGMNLYEYDFDAPAGKKISRISVGGVEPKVLGVARVSEDGSHVYFVAEDALTGANAEDVSPVSGEPNLYVFAHDSEHPAGQVVFIGTLTNGAEDREDWRRSDEERPVQATPDGRYLVFRSAADLTPGDFSAVPQVFEYDSSTEELVRVSVGEAGYAKGQASADERGATITPQNYSLTLEASAATKLLAVSADGSQVVFQSSGGLTGAAAAAGEANRESVYVYRSGARLSQGSVSLVSSGTGVASASLNGEAEIGGSVFFKTSEPLLAADGDTQNDLYVARDDGGFPSPGLSRDCERAGHLCQGERGSISPIMGGANVFEPGGGNLPVLIVKPSPGLTPAQKLTAALKVCRHGPRLKRRACEARAHRRYGVHVKTKGRG